jgi:hypothetical protein
MMWKRKAEQSKSNKASLATTKSASLRRSSTNTWTDTMWNMKAQFLCSRNGKAFGKDVLELLELFLRQVMQKDSVPFATAWKVILQVLNLRIRFASPLKVHHQPLWS